MISSAIATLPAIVYETLPDGNRRERPDHPVARLIRQPNQVHDLARPRPVLHGASPALWKFDPNDGAPRNGQPIALNSLPWLNAQPIMVPAQPEEAMGPLAPSGRLAFDTLRTVAPSGGTGVPRRYFAEEIFYLRDRSDTGVLGSSRLARAPMLVQQGLSVQAFATYLWENVGTPNLALLHPGQLSNEASARIAQELEGHACRRAERAEDDNLEEGHEAGGVVSVTAGGPGGPRKPSSFVSGRNRPLVQRPAAPRRDPATTRTSPTPRKPRVWFATNTLSPWCIAIEREFARDRSSTIPIAFISNSTSPR